MNIRETLSHLIDKHGELLKLSRRQLADEAKVNPGQFSNWLRNDGPIGPDKQGALAEVALGRIKEYLDHHPEAPNRKPLERFQSVLVDFGPRLRRIAALPEVVLTGESISRDNPLYVKRSVDMDLEDRLRRDVIRIAIPGGPKTGKSSLLYVAQETLESSRNVLRVDFRSYQPTKPDDPRDASHALCRWIQSKCEEQMGGSNPASFDIPSQMSRWVASNLLSNSSTGRCVLLFDHVGSLYRGDWGQTDGADQVLVHAFQEAVALLSYQTGINAGLRRFGMICAFDPSEKAFQRGLSGLDTVDLDPFQGNHVNSLMIARDSLETDPLLPRKILEKTGGHPFVTQLLCEAAAKRTGDFAAALEQGRDILATAVKSRWSADRIEFAVRAMASNSPALPIIGHGVWDLMHSGLVAWDEDARGNIQFRPSVEGLSL